MNDALLHRMLDESAIRRPRHPAVEEISGNSISYSELAVLSDQLRDRLAHMGVVPGDRVGICVRKSINAVAAIFGILKAGAAYVPVDVSAPVSRTAYIFKNCEIRVLIVEKQQAEPLKKAMAELGGSPAQLIIHDPDENNSLQHTLAGMLQSEPAEQIATVYPATGELAYILYTSGSTGKPKGVMINHRAARFFVDWCSDTF
jgi:acyl-CoA synthetase (AMP-forming)/AMP-acid ligase II